MNVGGIPWSEQKFSSEEKNGFWNVLMLCAVILILLLACFWTAPLYNYVKTWQLNQAVRKRWLSTKKSIKWPRKPSLRGHGGYFRLWILLLFFFFILLFYCKEENHVICLIIRSNAKYKKRKRNKRKLNDKEMVIWYTHIAWSLSTLFDSCKVDYLQ